MVFIFFIIKITVAYCNHHQPFAVKVSTAEIRYIPAQLIINNFRALMPFVTPDLRCTIHKGRQQKVHFLSKCYRIAHNLIYFQSFHTCFIPFKNIYQVGYMQISSKGHAFFFRINERLTSISHG